MNRSEKQILKSCLLIDYITFKNLAKLAFLLEGLIYSYQSW
jgi:hypothetical protein